MTRSSRPKVIRVGASILVSIDTVSAAFALPLRIAANIGRLNNRFTSASAPADKIGRRNMILISATLMGGAIFCSAFSTSVTMLMVFRILSGMGIGSVLASTATLAAEYAPAKTKDFWISLVQAGYTMGAFLSGVAAQRVIPLYGWRALFQMAGCVTLAAAAFLFFFLPESLDFLLKTRPAGALQKANALLVRMRAPTLDALPALAQETKTKGSVRELFTEGRGAPTLFLCIALFLTYATLYFLTSWIPKLAGAAGLPESLAIYAGAVFNLGAFAGILSQGYLSTRFGLGRVVPIFLIASTLLMETFGSFSGSAMVLVVLGWIGFTVQGGFIGFYSMAAKLYPTEIRATGVGWVLGVGRLGSIVGPLAGGYLVSRGTSMSLNFMIFGVPLLLAAAATLLIRLGRPLRQGFA